MGDVDQHYLSRNVARVAVFHTLHNEGSVMGVVAVRILPDRTKPRFLRHDTILDRQACRQCWRSHGPFSPLGCDLEIIVLYL